MILNKKTETKDRCEHARNYVKIISLFYKPLTNVELDMLSALLCSEERNTRKFVKTFALSSKNSLSYVRNYLYKLQDKGYIQIDEMIKTSFKLEDKIQFNLSYEFIRESL